MVRYLLTAAGALALMSGAALAQTDNYSTKSVTVHRGAPHSTVYSTHAPRHNRTVTKRYVNQRGKVVTKSKTFHDGFSGSSVTRQKTVTDPTTGTSRTRTYIDR
jgi:hypothetical protein